MRKCRKKVQSASLVSSKSRVTGGALLFLPLLLFGLPSAKAHSGSALPGQSQGSSQAQSQKDSQAESQAVTAPQKDSGNKQQSPADASRQANAKKDKPKSKRVYTNDDLSSLGGGISVVGNRSSEGRAEANGNSSAGLQGKAPASSADRGEAYWRGKAQAIKDQITAVDQQIDRVKQEIAKSGPATFDPTTGLTQNVIILHDRNADLQRLQDRKQNLEKQLDDLTDEGRKAGANPGWFR